VWNKPFFLGGDGGPVLFAPDGTGYAWFTGGLPKILTSPRASFGGTWNPLPQGPGSNTDPDGFPMIAGATDATIGFDAAGFPLSRDGQRLLLGSWRVWERANGVWTNLRTSQFGNNRVLAYADSGLNYNTIYAAYDDRRIWRTTSHGAPGGQGWT